MAGDVKVAVVSGVISTGGAGTADFTKAGFGTPKACIILLSFDPTNNTAVEAESKSSIGFSDFTKHRCITHQDEDASAKVDSDSRKSATKAYVILNASAAVIIDGVASTITDGVRLTNTTNTDADAVFATVIMFGGADLKVSVDSTSIASAQDGTATITPGAGFDTSLIFFIGVDISGEDSSGTGINNSFGVCHINAPTYTVFTNRCIGWASDHNNPVGSPRSVIRNNRCLSQITESGVQDWGLEVTAAATDNITVTTRDAGAGAGMEVYSLALDIDDRIAKVGSVDSPISGTSWTPSVALGFIPQYVGLGLTRLTAENAISSTDKGGVQGISSNTGAGEETCHSWYNDFGGATTDTNNLFRSRAVDLRNDDATVVKFDFTHSSFNDGDWTYTIVSEDVTAAEKWFYFAIEEAAVGGVTNFKTINFDMVTAMATTPVAIFAKSISFAMVTSMSLTKKVGKAISFGMVTAMTVAKTVGVIRNFGMVMAMGVSRQTKKAISFGMITSMSTATAILITKAISFAMITAMTLVKKVQKTISFGMVTGFTVAKTISVIKNFGMVTAMSTAVALTVAKSISFSMVTSMATAAVPTFVKSVVFGIVTTMSTATNFIAGSPSDEGTLAWWVKQKFTRLRF